jgi:hypothetical protein
MRSGGNMAIHEDGGVLIPAKPKKVAKKKVDK